MSIIYNLINANHCGFYYDPIQGRLFKIEEITITHEDTDGKVRAGRSLFDGQYRLRTHIAYFIMTGKWPENLIDHKNGNQRDNSWNNLREATYQQNSYNRKSRRASTELEMGVETTPFGRYRVKVNGVHVGNFVSREQANAAARQARRKLYGEFDYNNREVT